MPAPAGEITVYDIDMVLGIVEEFVMQERCGTNQKITEEIQDFGTPTPVLDGSKMAVAKLLDGYLAEIAKDGNLSLTKFLDLAEMASGDSRPVHDGIYRAVDMYLKEHPNLSKSERKKLCSLMDCRKLSADACSHAVQNERLPLYVVVQVLFFEQVRASATIGSEKADNSSGGTYGSSTSVATTITTTEDNRDSATLPTAKDLKSLKSMKLVNGAKGSESSSNIDANKNHVSEDKVNAKVRGTMMPKIFGKLLSSKGLGGGGGGENNSFDTSGSPGSANQNEHQSL